MTDPTQTTDEMPHPWYGPCDAFMPDGGCAECDDVRRDVWSVWRIHWRKNCAELKDAPMPNETTRSVEDAVRHWWPGYWRGVLDGMIGGGLVSLLVWEYFHGWL
jgi:hypothetical protein